MSRVALVSLLGNDTELRVDGITTDSIHAFQSVDAPPASEETFIIVRWGISASSPFPSRGPVSVTLWVYDVPSSYIRIDRIIKRCREILENAVHVVGSDGWTLTTASWSGTSEDGYDDAFARLMKNVTFNVVSRPS